MINFKNFDLKPIKSSIPIPSIICCWNKLRRYQHYTSRTASRSCNFLVIDCYINHAPPKESEWRKKHFAFSLPIMIAVWATCSWINSQCKSPAAGLIFPNHASRLTVNFFSLFASQPIFSFDFKLSIDLCIAIFARLSLRSILSQFCCVTCFLRVSTARSRHNPLFFSAFFLPRFRSTLMNFFAGNFRLLRLLKDENWVGLKMEDVGGRATALISISNLRDSSIVFQFSQAAILHRFLLSHFCLLVLIRRCNDLKATKKKQSTNFVINFYWKAWLPENVFLDFFFASCCVFFPRAEQVFCFVAVFFAISCDL